MHTTVNHPSKFSTFLIIIRVELEGSCDICVIDTVLENCRHLRENKIIPDNPTNCSKIPTIYTKTLNATLLKNQTRENDGHSHFSFTVL